MFWEISQNSQKYTCARDSFSIKLEASGLLLKKRLWHRCFPVNFAKFLRKTFLQKTSGRLLLLFLLPVYLHREILLNFSTLLCSVNFQSVLITRFSFQRCSLICSMITLRELNLSLKTRIFYFCSAEKKLWPVRMVTEHDHQSTFFGKY